MAIYIGKYERYTIEYEDGLFIARKGKKEPEFRCRTEPDLKETIDRSRIQKIAQKEKEKREQELKKKNAKWKIAKYIVSAAKFAKFLERIEVLSRELKLEFSKNKIQAKVFDPGNVCVSKSTVACKGNQDGVDVAVPIVDIVNYCKSVKGKIELSLKLEGNKRFFVLDAGDSKLKVEEIELYKKENKIPALKELSVKLRFDRLKFMEIVEQASDVGHGMIIETIGNKITFRTENENENVMYESTLQIKKFKPAKAKYSLDYIIKFEHLEGKNLTIEFANDYPLKITDTKGNTYVLAPRVESD